MKITKKQVREFVKRKLSSDPAWAKKALLLIFSYQTNQEQVSDTTRERNDVGFSAFDAEILSSFAKQLLTKNSLSNKQMDILFKKICHYHRQIIENSNQEKLNKLVLASGR